MDAKLVTPSVFRTLCLLLAAAALLPGETKGQQRDAASAEVLEAESFFESGDYKEAIRRFKAAEALSGQPVLRSSLGLAMSLNRVGAHRDAQKQGTSSP
jgi:hypothetical protein